MKTAKIFKNGRSQAVRLPKEFRFDAEEVAIRKIGSIVILYPVDSRWTPLLSASGQFTEDFMTDRNQPHKSQHRNLL